MARSHKYRPFFACCSGSEKEDKRLANRNFRHKAKLRAKSGSGEFLLMREISNVWAFGKDGKWYMKKAGKKEMRK
jgi:hypothetical protein